MVPLAPFTDTLDCRTVVFDAPYFNLACAPAVKGLVSWGAHDPGTAAVSRPDGLLDEIVARFGEYPAKPWIYGMVWQSAEQTAAMAEGLVEAIELRGAIAQWLLTERLPDWELGLMVVSEYHSAIEACWHGVDPSHPLHDLPSAAPARAAVEGVYEAADRMIGELNALFPDAKLVLFNLHGMGPNDSDAMSMWLLSELLHRDAFGTACVHTPGWHTVASGAPLIPVTSDWASEVDRALPLALRRRGPVRRRLDALRTLGGYAAGSAGSGGAAPAAAIDWMPATRYRRYWPRMRAFALPSYYDGRIRINLQGRESRGIVAPDDYDETCDHLEALVRDCRNALTGAPVVAEIERASRPGHALAPSEADLVIVWKDAPLGVVHPRLGTIGPVPYRRTGGHTGGSGFAHIVGAGVKPGAHGMRSAFDVVPTVVDMMGGSPAGLSGESFRSLVEL
ncbi:MAG: hypothetical protein JWN69_22, partial [Alphaproteobacteria bacterium]|nr:hypothetical protein [Alphaproteobacteria bacterium]